MCFVFVSKKFFVADAMSVLFNFAYIIAPIVLVCTNINQRQLAKDKRSLVEFEVGYAVAEKIGAYAYMECVPQTRHGVNEVLETATRCALLTKNDHEEMVTLSLDLRQKALGLKDSHELQETSE